ncbi:hypothetical protein EIP91_000544 [Steccherinum ochraceum]|uniref:Uncharacterized protein n=1 Tax=Steccherinum ochraceum TaxID=92696 RepID=A0A4R0RW61_9APHY|nr:hypothetical protein EIP91_000544 [Steccherinum ochraceum]
MNFDPAFGPYLPTPPCTIADASVYIVPQTNCTKCSLPMGPFRAYKASTPGKQHERGKIVQTCSSGNSCFWTKTHTQPIYFDDAVLFANHLNALYSGTGGKQLDTNYLLKVPLEIAPPPTEPGYVPCSNDSCVNRNGTRTRGSRNCIGHFCLSCCKAQRDSALSRGVERERCSTHHQEAVRSNAPPWPLSQLTETRNTLDSYPPSTGPRPIIPTIVTTMNSIPSQQSSNRSQTQLERQPNRSQPEFSQADGRPAMLPNNLPAQSQPSEPTASQRAPSRRRAAPLSQPISDDWLNAYRAAQQEKKAQVDIKQLRQEAERQERSMCELVIWRQSNESPIVLKHSAPAFPFLYLSNVPLLINKEIGLGLSTDSIIDIWTGDYWNVYTVSQPIKISSGQRVLIRVHPSLLNRLRENDCLDLARYRSDNSPSLDSDALKSKKRARGESSVDTVPHNTARPPNAKRSKLSNPLTTGTPATGGTLSDTVDLTLSDDENGSQFSRGRTQIISPSPSQPRTSSHARPPSSVPAAPQHSTRLSMPAPQSTQLDELESSEDHHAWPASLSYSVVRDGMAEMQTKINAGRGKLSQRHAFPQVFPGHAFARSTVLRVKNSLAKLAEYGGADPTSYEGKVYSFFKKRYFSGKWGPCYSALQAHLKKNLTLEELGLLGNTVSDSVESDSSRSSTPTPNSVSASRDCAVESPLLSPVLKDVQLQAHGPPPSRTASGLSTASDILPGADEDDSQWALPLSPSPAPFVLEPFDIYREAGYDPNAQYCNFCDFVFPFLLKRSQRVRSR